MHTFKSTQLLKNITMSPPITKRKNQKYRIIALTKLNTPKSCASSQSISQLDTCKRIQNPTHDNVTHTKAALSQQLKEIAQTGASNKANILATLIYSVEQYKEATPSLEKSLTAIIEYTKQLKFEINESTPLNISKAKSENELLKANLASAKEKLKRLKAQPVSYCSKKDNNRMPPINKSRMSEFKEPYTFANSNEKRNRALNESDIFDKLKYGSL